MLSATINHMAAGQRRQRTQRRRGAFTLLEILLALGLSVTLLVAVYAALDLYRHVTTAGRDDVRRAQLARTLLRKMQIDIQSVLYRDPGGDAAAPASESDDSEDDDDLEAEVVDPADAYLNTSIGVIGDSQTLVLHVNRPSRNREFSAIWEAGDDSVHLSDLQSIAYFLAVSGGDGLQGLVGDLAQSGNTNGSTADGIQGLARLEGDRLAINLADEQADLETMARQTKLLAEEVNSLQFRYFDGVDVFESWDSVTDGSLPVAIEITIGFRPAEEDSADSTNHSDSGSSIDTYRLVVFLPLAEPYLPEPES